MGLGLEYFKLYTVFGNDTVLGTVGTACSIHTSTYNGACNVDTGTVLVLVLEELLTFLYIVISLW